RCKTTAEWQTLLDQTGIPAMPVKTTDDLYHDPHLRSVGFFQMSDDEKLGRMCYPKQPVRFDGQMPQVKFRAPKLGEHTAEVLEQAGFSTDEIKAMRPC